MIDIEKYSEKLLKAVESTANFASEQAPLYVQELLAWEFTEAVIDASLIGLLSIFLIAATVICIRKGLIILKSDGYDKNLDTHGKLFALAGMIGLCGLLAAGFVLENLKHSIKVKTSPRVIIIEKLTELNYRIVRGIPL